MTQRKEMETLLHDAYAARKRGDVAAITKMFADNAHFELVGAPQASPIALRCTDRDAFQTVMAGLIKTFEFLDHEILAMIIEGNRAAVHWRSRMRSGITGEEVVTELVDLVTIENGRITSFLEFCDTALAAKLIGGEAGRREALFA